MLILTIKQVIAKSSVDMMTSSLTVNTICWDYDYERDSEGNFCKKNSEILENYFVEFSYTRRWQSSETGEHTYVE